VQKAVKPFGLAVFKCPVFVDYDKGTRRRASRTGRACCGARRRTIIRGAVSSPRDGAGGLGRSGFGGRGWGTGFGGRGPR
jgi:hypothetical protein